MKPTEAIPSNASPKARQYINAGRTILYSDKMVPVLKQMLTGSDTLAKSSVPFIMQLIMSLQAKLGPLYPQDLRPVGVALCASVVTLAHDLGDPDARNPQRALAKMIIALRDFTAQGQQAQQAQQGQPGAPPGGPPSAPPPAAGPAPLQQLGG